MASALCTFSLPSSSLSCSNQPGVSSFSSRCSDVLGDGSRPFHQLGCQTELADSTAGIVAQPRASNSPHFSFLLLLLLPPSPFLWKVHTMCLSCGAQGIRVWHIFALGLWRVLVPALSVIPVQVSAPFSSSSFFCLLSSPFLWKVHTHVSLLMCSKELGFGMHLPWGLWGVFVLELMCGVLGGCGQKPKQVGCVIWLGRRQTMATRCHSPTIGPRRCRVPTYSTSGCGGKKASALWSCAWVPRHWRQWRRKVCKLWPRKQASV